MSKPRIALFRNDGSAAGFTHSDLPDLNSAQDPEVRFNDWRDFAIPAGHALRSQTCSNPVYSNDVVYWAVHGQAATSKLDSVVSVWRIAKHFKLAGVDRTAGVVSRSHGDMTFDFQWGCAPFKSNNRPGVVVNGKIVTVSCLGRYNRLHTCQKGEDGSWADVFLDPSRPDWQYRETYSLDYHVSEDEARSLVMFTGSDFAPSINYTYRFVSEPANGSPLRIDMMNTTDFASLRKETSLNWDRVTGETHIGGVDHAYVITNAEDGSHKLYFFDFGSDGSFIFCRWIYLQKDGNIDPDKNTYHKESRYGSSNGYYEVGKNGLHLKIAEGAPGTGTKPWWQNNPRQIMAFTWTVTETEKQKDDEGTEIDAHIQVQNLALIWHTDVCFAGITGKLDKDGGIPADWKWRNLNVFTHGPHPPAHGYDVHGVIVPADYC